MTRPADSGGSLDWARPPAQELRGHPARSACSATPSCASRAVEVVDFDKELRKLVEDLTDTMLDAPGAGLAAPQIGVGLRVFTWNVDGRGRPPGQPAPRPVRGDPGRPRGLPVDPRADLRLPPGAVGRRHTASTCTASRCRSRARELLARAIQHETDHLDGVLFIDRLDAEARKAAMKAIRESEWFGLEKPDGQGLPARHPAGSGL